VARKLNAAAQQAVFLQYSDYYLSDVPRIIPENASGSLPTV